MKIPGTFGPSVGTTTADQRIAEVMTLELLKLTWKEEKPPDGTQD